MSRASSAPIVSGASTCFAVACLDRLHAIRHLVQTSTSRSSPILCKLKATMASTSVLSAQERAVLTAICDAFHPPLAAGPDDDAALFATSAVEAGVPAAAAEAIGLLATAQQSELRQLLRLLDNTVVSLALSRSTRGVSAMTRAERSRLLSKLSTSPIPQLR